MPNAKSKELLLTSVVSGELEHLGMKLDFWQAEHPPGETLWQSGKPLSLEDVLALFDPESEEFDGSKELGLLYGIAWEFVWGKEPPEVATSLRNEIIAKVRCGLELNELEKLWHNLIVVDTDMF